MRSWKIIPHTADTKLQVIADSVEELFKGALEGMSDIIKHSVTKNPSDLSTVTQVDLSANDITVLLVDFLNDLLTKDVIEKVVFYDVVELELKNTHLVASIRGVPSDSFDEDIKAVTYHGADVRQNADRNYQVEVVFDV